MKCFVHSGVDAVALCKHCHKATCGSCVIDTGEGIACSEACAENVREVAVVVRTSTAATRINRSGAAFLMPGFFVLMGVIFIGEELLSGGSPGMGTMMGAVFVTVGVALGLIQATWRRRSAKPR